jgi:hypothetical protein
MGTLLKIFLGFWAIWLLWYVTGGPLRDDKTKPFVNFSKEGQLQASGTTTGSK